MHDLHEQVARPRTAERTPFAVCVVPRRGATTRCRRSSRRCAGRAARRSAARSCRLAPGEPLAETAARVDGPGTGTLLVVLDQFEEYFLYHPDEDDDERARLRRRARRGSSTTRPARERPALDPRGRAGRSSTASRGTIPRCSRTTCASTTSTATPRARRSKGRSRRGTDAAARRAAVRDRAGARRGGARRGRGRRGSRSAAGGESAAAERDRGDRVEAPFLQLVLERLWRDAVAGRRAHAHARPARGARRRRADRREPPRSTRSASSRPPSRTSPPTASASSSAAARRRSRTPPPTSPSGRTGPRPRSRRCSTSSARRESGRILRAVAPPRATGSTSYELFHDVLAEPILEWRKRVTSSDAQAEARRRAGGSVPPAARRHRCRADRARRRVRRTRRSGRSGRRSAREARDRRRRPRSPSRPPRTTSWRATSTSSLLLSLEAYQAQADRAGEEQHDLGARSRSALRRGGDPSHDHGAVTGVAFSPDGRDARHGRRRRDGGALGCAHADPDRSAAERHQGVDLRYRLQPGWANARHGRLARG